MFLPRTFDLRPLQARLAAGLRRLRESLGYLFRALISMRNRSFVLIFAGRLATGALTAAARRSLSSAMDA